MIKKFIYRTADANPGGGAGMSLAELEALDEQQENKSNEGDDPDKDKQPEETEDERIARETEEADKKAKEAGEEENKKPDGEEGDKDDKRGEAGEDEDEEVTEFLAEVNALRGDEIEVEYPEGVDPLSPAGVVLRERAIEDAAVENFEVYLETKYPKAYAYLLHTIAGKPEDDFFGNSSHLETLPTAEELEASVEVQKSVVLINLLAKGNSEKHAGLIIKQLIEDNELEEAAKSSLEERNSAQKAELDRIKADNDKELEIKEEAIKQMNTYIENVVNTGKIGKIEIPLKDRPAFAKHFKDNVRYDKGKFVMVSELSNENIGEAFAKEYFHYKKGDLGDIITKKAKTENANRLRRTAEDSKKTPKGGAESGKRVVTLGEIDTD